MVTTKFRLFFLLIAGFAAVLIAGCGDTRVPIREGVAAASPEPGSSPEGGETPPSAAASGEDAASTSEGERADGSPADDSGSEDPTEESSGSEDPTEESSGSEDPTEESSGSEDPTEESFSSEDPTEESSGSEEAGSEETAPDSDPWAGRPLGQCAQSSDCPEGPNGRRCSRSLPGGACTGCGSDEHCPGSTVCYVGTCVQECEALADCPPGLYCLGSGRCGTSWCVDGACPVPLFTCTSTMRCERAICESAAECPERTTCVGGRCIEDRVLLR